MNQYSLLHNYNGIALESPDFQLATQGMAAKQGQLEANRNEVQQEINKVAKSMVIKGEDQAYLDDRLNKVMAIANKYSSGNLTDAILKNSLVSNIDQVYDERLQNAMNGTAKYLGEQQEWSDARKKGDGKYSTINHQYAMQKANAWLSDGQAGTVYNGGGGFREYRDLSKKAMDNLPKIADALKAKYIQTGPTEGYFQSIDTYEVIPKNKVASVVDSMFDSTDKEQMKINAWADYQGANPTLIKKDWEDYNSDNKDRVQSEIDALRVMRNDSSYASQFSDLDAAIKNKEETLKYHDNNTFESAQAVLGNEGAGQELYYSKFKNNLVSTFSKEPTLIDRKVDEVQKANREYELDLRQQDERERHNREMEAAKMASAAAKNGNSYSDFDADGVPDLLQPFQKTGTIDVKPNAEKLPMFVRHQQRVDGLVSGLKSQFKASGIENPDEILRSREFTSLLQSGFAGKIGSKVSINGETVHLTKDLVNKLEDYSEEFLTVSPAKKAVFGGINTTLNSIGESLTKGLKTNNSTPDNIPNFNIAFSKNDQGGLTITNISNANSNRFAYLLKKDPSKLSETEKKTKNLYLALHTYNDPEITPEQKSLYRDYISRDLLKDVDNKGFKKVSFDVAKRGGIFPNSTTTVPSFGIEKDIFISQFTRGDVGDNILVQAMGAAGAAQGYGREAARDIEDPANILKKGTKNIGTMLERTYLSEGNLLSADKYQVSYDTHKDAHRALQRRLGLEKESKNNIFVEPEIGKNGLPTDRSKVTITAINSKTNKDGEVIPGKTETTYLSNDEIRQMGVADIITNKQQSRYDASNPANARTVRLGSGVYDYTPNRGLEKAKMEEVLQEFQDLPTIATELKRVNSKYANGEYVFEFQPSKEGIYKGKLLRQDGSEVAPGFFVQGKREIDPTMLDYLKANPKELGTDLIMSQFLKYYGDHLEHRENAK